MAYCTLVSDSADPISTAQERLSQVASHLGASEVDLGPNRDALLRKDASDIVVTCALRTPITKGGKGGFKDTAGADLLHGAFRALIQRSGIEPGLVQDICVGNVLAPGGWSTDIRCFVSSITHDK